ncbi:hydrogenase expression/formation protein HypE [Candidatus Frackibacter sp. WG13]|uniref:hydrogenase expression/formation protein HypE n=1 Tax=unclassified Candidatus Frackibacter TaxID=2648818 RepID=UPI00403D5F7B
MGMEEILLSHGSGGKLTQNLIDEIFIKELDNEILRSKNDAAILDLEGERLAFTTDSFVINPIFFPGGNIGELAVCGTVNDLATSGAIPKYLSLSLIIEEGLPITELKQVIKSVSETAKKAGVKIVTGDTKVVAKGEADKLYINTTGVGSLSTKLNISADRAKPGDMILVNGNLGEHGIAVLSERKGLEFETIVKSDTAPLSGLVSDILEVTDQVKVLRDPTRGGLATTLNEIAEASQVGIKLQEDKLPISETVEAASQMLGLDPLYLANEGKLIVIVPEEEVEDVLEAMQKSEYGVKSAIIGQVTADEPGRVVLENNFGASRVLDMLTGEMLPRIC